MGTRTEICGLVFTDPCYDALNARVIEGYPYDEVYPLRAVFSAPIPGYQGSVISFATSIKATRDEWDEWLKAFERLLAKLVVISARVTLEEAEAGNMVTYTYVVTEHRKRPTRVSRWRSVSGPDEEEVSFIL